MKKLVLGSFIFASTFLSVGFAQAGVINFNDGTTTNPDGLQFKECNIGGGNCGAGVSVYDAIDPVNGLGLSELEPSNHGNVAVNDGSGMISITRSGGDGLFSFSGLSFGNLFGWSEKLSITVVINDKSTKLKLFEFGSPNSWMTLSSSNFVDSDSGTLVDTTSISELEISSFDGDLNPTTFMLDDITLEAINTNTNDVPEPEALALMLLGLPMVGWVARRRNNTTHTL